MRAGLLKRQITFEKNNQIKSGSGSTTDNWINFYTCRADIRFKSGNKIIEDQEIFTAQFLEINIRFTSGIDESLRISYNGRFYRILFIDEPDFHQSLKITAEKIII